MKKLLFIIVILVLLWSVSGLHAAPLEGEGDRPSDNIDEIESQMRVVLDRVSPSLVKVVAENGQKYVATGIALESGLVITSTQVIRRPFAKLTVETTRGESIAARVAGQDPRTGLALLRLEKKGLTPLPRAGQIEVGNWVALVGLFYDRFPAIFQGIVSSRSDNELILNAPVAPGSVGGAVVNKKGELLGIIRGSIGFTSSPDFTFKDHAASIMVSGSRSESGSLCYAIPIDGVQRVAEKLKTAGRVVPGWLGIFFADDTNQVQDVYKGSPAAKAGIAGNDRVVKLAGKQVGNWHDIVSALEFRFAGDRIDVTVDRAGKARNLSVTLGDRSPAVPKQPEPPDAVPEIADLPDLAQQLTAMPELAELATALPRARNYVIEFAGSRQLGVDVMEITAELGGKFGVKEGFGLLVSQVNEGSAAIKAGLKAGDIIVRANGSTVRGAVDLRRALAALKDKEAVRLELYRDGQARTFSLVPDMNEKRSLDIQRFAQKMENLKDSIHDETRGMYQEELKKLLQAREKALSDLQKEKQQSLKKIQDESRKMAMELKQLQQQKEKLAAGAWQKFAADLQRLQAELRRIQERMQQEIAKEGKGEER